MKPAGRNPAAMKMATSSGSFDADPVNRMTAGVSLVNREVAVSHLANTDLPACRQSTNCGLGNPPPAVRPGRQVGRRQLAHACLVPVQIFGAEKGSPLAACPAVEEKAGVVPQPVDRDL